jgi:hypothetical protein
MVNIDNTLNGNPELFNTQVPALSDDANIQEALRLYHYGTDTVPSNPANIEPESVAGYFRAVQIALSTLQPEPKEVLGAGENLNSKTSQGIYSQDSDADARSLNSLNYPLFSTNLDGSDGLAYAGLLSVIVHENIIYQTYQMTSVPGFFFRSRVGSVWSAWTRMASFLHNHNNIYYTKEEMDQSLQGKQASIPSSAPVATLLSTALTQDRALISNSSGQVAVIGTNVTSTSLGLLANTTQSVGKTNSSPNGTAPRLVFSDAPQFTGFPSANSEGNATVPTRSTTSNILVTQSLMARDAITSKTSSVNNAGIFIQQAQPSNATVNDLWIW